MPALTRRRIDESLRAIETLHEQINRLYDFSGSRGTAANEESIPFVDISEDKDNVYVEADLPGMEQTDIDLSLDDNHLVLSGHGRETKEEEPPRNYFRRERPARFFYRELALPSSVDTARAKASYTNGVLNIVLPKKEEPAERGIKISIE